MNVGKDEPQEPTSSYGATTGSFTARLPAVLAAHQHWVQTGGKEGKRADLSEAALRRTCEVLIYNSPHYIGPSCKGPISAAPTSVAPICKGRFPVC
jgi:hypothetical protein